MILKKIEGLIPKKTIEIYDLPYAFLLNDADWKEFLETLPTQDKADALEGKTVPTYKGVRILHKSEVIEV